MAAPRKKNQVQSVGISQLISSFVRHKLTLPQQIS